MQVMQVRLNKQNSTHLAFINDLWWPYFEIQLLNTQSRVVDVTNIKILLGHLNMTKIPNHKYPPKRIRLCNTTSNSKDTDSSSVSRRSIIQN